MNEILGGWQLAGWVALKTVLLYGTAILGFRLCSRRTLAEMSAFDFVAAVAVGSVVARASLASSVSFLQGAVTIVSVLLCHHLISKLRRSPAIAKFFDHAPRVLVSRGAVLEQELRECGLTRSDLFGLLREHGVVSLDQIHLVIFEQRGKISVIRDTDLRDPHSPLVREFERTPSPAAG